MWHVAKVAKVAKVAFLFGVGKNLDEMGQK